MDALIELLNFVKVDQSKESVALRGDIEVQMKHSELPLVFDSDHILAVKKRMAELKRMNFELFESTQPLLDSARKPTFGFGRFVPPAGATAAPPGICHPSPEWGAQFALRAIEELRQKKADDEEKQVAGLQDKVAHAIPDNPNDPPPRMSLEEQDWCGVAVCQNPKRVAGLYCRSHTCTWPDCSCVNHNGLGSYCGAHCCNNQFCKRARVPGHSYCFDHVLSEQENANAELLEIERVRNELRERMRKNKGAWYLDQPEPRILDNPGPTCCSIPSCFESNISGSYYCAGHSDGPELVMKVAADPRSPPSSPELKPTDPPATAMAAMTLADPTIRDRLATVLKERGFTAYPDLNAEWLQEMDSVIALASKSVTLTPDHIIRMAENALDAQLARIRTPKVEPMD